MPITELTEKQFKLWKDSPIIIEDRPDGTFWLVLRAQDGYYEVQVERRVDAKQ